MWIVGYRLFIRTHRVGIPHVQEKEIVWKDLYVMGLQDGWIKNAH